MDAHLEECERVSNDLSTAIYTEDNTEDTLCGLVISLPIFKSQLEGPVHDLALKTAQIISCYKKLRSGKPRILFKNRGPMAIHTGYC